MPWDEGRLAPADELFGMIFGEDAKSPDENGGPVDPTDDADTPLFPPSCPADWP